MCLAFYLFSNDVIPTIKWNQDAPAVFISKIVQPSNRNVLAWPHTQKHVYKIGSYQGCGCGWSPVNEWDRPSDITSKKEDRKALVDILKSIKLPDTWLVVCWEGTQGQELFPETTIQLSNIEDTQFEFVELQKYRVTSE